MYVDDRGRSRKELCMLIEIPCISKHLNDINCLERPIKTTLSVRTAVKKQFAQYIWFLNPMFYILNLCAGAGGNGHGRLLLPVAALAGRCGGPRGGGRSRSGRGGSSVPPPRHGAASGGCRLRRSPAAQAKPTAR